MKEIKNIIGKNLKSILYVIVIFGIIIRFYFLNIAKSQAHWWDSLAYGSLAKNMIYHLWDNNPFLMHEAVIRPPLLPIIWSFLLRLGASDYTVILLTNLIPSIISIFLVYLIGKEMYGRKVGIIASIIASFSWIHIFYATRIMTDIPSMTLILASLYFFLKSYESLQVKLWTISVGLLSLAVLFRYSHAVIAFAYIVFLVLVHKKKLIGNKKFWQGGLTGSIPIVLFIIINIFTYGSILPAGEEYISSAGQKAEFAWYTLGFLSHILRSPLVWLFYIGIIAILYKTSISYGFILKEKETKMHIFNIIMLFTVLSFFIFGIKASEDRYLLGLSGILFVIPALSLSYIYNLLSKNKMELAAIVIILFLLWSAYSNIIFAQTMITDKKETYKQMKDAFTWIKYNTPEKAVVTGEWADPYSIYYAEREIQVLSENFNYTGFNLQADYVVLTGLHQVSPNFVEYVNDLVSKNLLVPVKAFFFDAEQTKPAVIIYRRV